MCSTTRYVAPATSDGADDEAGGPPLVVSACGYHTREYDVFGYERKTGNPSRGKDVKR
jgi:hypothetical protein